MANFVKLGIENIVVKGVVISNDVATTEQIGVNFLNITYGTNDVWKQTSYNTRNGIHILGGTPFRKNYAGIGYTYDENRDAFIPPKPFNSWLLNEDTCQWQSPIPYPTTNTKGMYIWNEETQSWELQNYIV